MGLLPAASTSADPLDDLEQILAIAFLYCPYSHNLIDHRYASSCRSILEMYSEIKNFKYTKNIAFEYFHAKSLGLIFILLLH